jgi:hypothetical protein
MTTIKLSSKQELEVYHNKTIEVNKKGYKMYIRQDMNGTPKAYDMANNEFENIKVVSDLFE